MVEEQDYFHGRAFDDQAVKQGDVTEQDRGALVQLGHDGFTISQSVNNSPFLQRKKNGFYPLMYVESDGNCEHEK